VVGTPGRGLLFVPMDGKHVNIDVPADGTDTPSTSDIRLYSTNGAAKVLGISSRKVWRLVYADRLRTVWIDGRRLIPADAIDEFVAALPTEKPDLTAVAG
jgi:excisionase family DNA binding protein